MNHRRLTMPAALVLYALTPSGNALADEVPDPDRPLSDLPSYEAPVPDLIPIVTPSFAPPLVGGAALSVVVAARMSDRRADMSGSLVLELPFDGFTSRKAKESTIRKTIESAPSASESSESESSAASSSERGASDGGTHHGANAADDGAMTLPIVKPGDARAAVAAAERMRKTGATLEALDGMATRARYGSLLPTLRLRATRLVDESTSLSPTSYDADRTTSRGGASLWLEARATWNLDRLVFASEEPRVSRIRLSFASDERKASRRVVEQLFAWQRAVFAMHDPTRSVGGCIEAWLTAQELAATLDLATGGWFAKWSRGKAGPMPECVAAFQRGY